MPWSPCVRCADCDGFPCLVHAKSDAEVLAVRPALQYKNLTLVTDAQVTELRTNAVGTAVTEVVARHKGEPVTYTAGIVVVSCGAANSAKLLLESANDKHPRGLANGSDQVGRNYMFHNSAAVLAVSREPNPTKYQKTLGLNDFYFGMKGFEYPMGNIQMVGKSQGPMYKGEKPLEAGLAPMWSLDTLARHAVDFWLSTEDLPRPDNRVTVDRDGHIHLSYTLNNQVPKQQLYAKLKSMLNSLGMDPRHLIPRKARYAQIWLHAHTAAVV
jgi:choline dehydrogenase-like flavoprotein